MLKTPIYRTYQGIMKIFARLYKFREPFIVKDVGILPYVAEIIKREGYKKPLIVMGNTLYSLKVHEKITENLTNLGIEYAIFHDTVNNPTISNIMEGLKAYKDNKCDSIIALGGGSPMDAAKIIGALVVNPKKNVEDLKGMLHVHRNIPFFIAIPTTAGTGSEITIAAVVSNDKTHHKFSIIDPHLVPNYVVFDPETLFNLPPSVTAATGMDALTHAVEAFIGRSNTKKTSRSALESIKLIYENLYNSYKEGKVHSYRINMQEASYKAGYAITNAYVGYVHAIAHSLGGKYNVSHGVANAIILPYVLESYGKKAYKKLAQISDELSLCEKSCSNEQKAKSFIAWIRKLNKDMEIPEKFDIKYNKKDVDEMIKHAIKEGNPLYPVPRIFNYNDFDKIYHQILK